MSGRLKRLFGLQPLPAPAPDEPPPKRAPGIRPIEGHGPPTLRHVLSGAWYLDVDANVLYGPKTADGWGRGESLGSLRTTPSTPEDTAAARRSRPPPSDAIYERSPGMRTFAEVLTSRGMSRETAIMPLASELVPPETAPLPDYMRTYVSTSDRDTVREALSQMGASYLTSYSAFATLYGNGYDVALQLESATDSTLECRLHCTPPHVRALNDLLNELAGRPPVHVTVETWDRLVPHIDSITSVTLTRRATRLGGFLDPNLALPERST